MFIRCLLFFNQLDGGSNYKRKPLTIKVSDVTGCILAILYLIGFLLHIIDKSEMSLNGSLRFTVIASKLSIPMGELYPDLFQSQNKLYWAKSVAERTSEGKLHTSLCTEPSSQINTFNNTITVMIMRG